MMKTLLRSLVGIGLLYYVFASGMIHWDLLAKALANPLDAIVVQASLFCVVLSQSLRWRVMNASQANHISYRRLVEITLIGHFFSVFSPSSVGLDVVRGWYTCGESSSKNSSSILTIILDRVLGLWSLFFTASVAGFVFVFAGKARYEIQILTWISFAVAFGGIALAAVGAKLKLKPPSISRFPWFLELYESFLRYVASPIVLLRAACISFSVTFFTLVPFVYLGHRMGIEFTLLHYLFVVPLGMMAVAIPLLPFGLGVGQVAFYQIASWLGTSAPQSSTLITVLQAQSLIFCVLCGVVYLKAGSRIRSNA